MSFALAEPASKPLSRAMPSCRHCGASLTLTFADLGVQPLANVLIRPSHALEPETFYSLTPMVCRWCSLVQLPNLAARGDLFDDYPYFSGQSHGWVRHCAVYARTMISLYGPRTVLEVGSNDGTLLLEFLCRGVDAIGVEPARNVAEVARQLGAFTDGGYWGRSHPLANGKRFDLVVANNVLAHVPDFDDFIGGITQALAPEGVVTFEFPHLASLIKGREWDTIYHEHHSYLSGNSTVRILGERGLRVFHVELLSTHGGSLRIYACHHTAKHKTGAGVPHFQRWETGLRSDGTLRCQRSLDNPNHLADFAIVPPADRERALRFLLDEDLGTIAAYGAPAKGMVWLNYLGLDRDMIPLIVDSTPAKQGKLAPGCRIPIEHPDMLSELRPDTILILPWNWELEIRAKILRDCPWAPRVIGRWDWQRV